jgi:hypothetical protein
VRETTHDREFDSRFDAAFQPGFEDSLGIDFREMSRDPLEEDGSDPAPVPRRSHPLIDRFVIALWAIGAALVLAGVLGLTRAIAGFQSSSYGPTPDYLMSMVFGQLAPWFVATGIATIVGTLFLLAVRWERRP